MVAFLTINPERVTALFTGLLAVAGGYLAGFVLAGTAAYFLDRFLTGGKSPATMHKLARHAGGVLGAVLVAFLVFGSGVGTGGGTAGTDAGTGTGSTTGPTTPATGPRPADVPVVVPPPPEVPPEEVVQVTVMSGTDVQAERFYLVDADRTPRTLAEVKQQIAAWRPAGGRPVAVAVRLAPRTDRENSGVKDLETWARDAGMRVILPKSE